MHEGYGYLGVSLSGYFSFDGLYGRQGAEKKESVSGAAPDVEDDDQAIEEHERVLLCKLCDLEITKARERTSRSGKHLHTFFNPAGVIYEIGCFQSAPGCLMHGQASSEFSWFAGYQWQVALCSQCHEHLGWLFSSGDETFFGLIVNRLKEGR